MGKMVGLDRDPKTKKWIVVIADMERHPGLASGKAFSVKKATPTEYDSFHEAEEELKIAFQQNIIDPVINGIYNDGST